MDFELNGDQKEFQNVMRDFVNKEINPVAMELEKSGEYPTKIVQGLKDLGLFGMTVPEEYGGDTIFVDVSAKNNLNITELIDSILLTADAGLDLRANPVQDAQGVAIEANLDMAEKLLARGDGTFSGLTGTMIMEAARAGDVIAIEAFRTTGKWIGAAVASLSAILDPEIVVIGGGVIDAGELLLAPIREAAKRHMPFSEILPMPEIVGATLGNQAAGSG